MNHHDRRGEGHHSHSQPDGCSAGFSGGLSDTEKLLKIVEHWIHHNREHVASYREWARRARAMGYEEASSILEKVAGDNELQNAELAKILETVGRQPR